MATQIAGLNLDESQRMQWGSLERLDKDNELYRLQTKLFQRVNEMMVPVQTKMRTLTRLVDQLIINVDKHENQIDIIETALYGKSRAANLADEIEKEAQDLQELKRMEEAGLAEEQDSKE